MDHLQEAYLSVYEEKDDSYLETDMEKRKKNNEKAVEDMKKTKAHRDMVKAAEKHFNESDAYDVILSHLLDEGFADTEQNAITIMANMSEAWIDEILDEAQIMSVSGKGGLKHMINPTVLKLQNAAAKEAQGRKAKEQAAKETKNTERAAQARKKSIQTLNAKPGEDSGSYDSYYHGDDDTSGGKRHYSLSHTNRSDRTRRAKGQ
jgi:hypothetical protein